MKRIKILGSVFMIALISMIAYPSMAQKAAKVKFDKLVHDYGVMEQGSDKGYCEFTITNTGNDVLFIMQVIKSCGCTTPEFSKEPIPPGGTSVIKVGYNTDLLGKFNKTITVQTNAENNRVTLRIKGEVVAAKENSTGDSTDSDDNSDEESSDDAEE